MEIKNPLNEWVFYLFLRNIQKYTKMISKIKYINYESKRNNGKVQYY